MKKFPKFDDNFEVGGVKETLPLLSPLMCPGHPNFAHS